MSALIIMVVLFLIFRSPVMRMLLFIAFLSSLTYFLR